MDNVKQFIVDASPRSMQNLFRFHDFTKEESKKYEEHEKIQTKKENMGDENNLMLKYQNKCCKMMAICLGNINNNNIFSLIAL